ncbi:hypothetical protein SESBI_28353 [Sesbania bispinosa]|nr:hypothetical protein SESBI_28353 [Sesbania bispinosa]
MSNEIDAALPDASICPHTSSNAGVLSALECRIYHTFGRMSCDKGVCARVIHARACRSRKHPSSVSPHAAMVVV